MGGSGTIRILKRDGSAEAFDRRKLAGVMYRAMSASRGTFEDAAELAWAIEVYLDRCGWWEASSAAIFEMAVKVLRRVALPEAAAAMESHRTWRRRRREQIRVRHAGGHWTQWDRNWLAQLACRNWRVSSGTGRIISAEVESAVLAEQGTEVSREQVVAHVNRLVGEFGLADAVPVAPPTAKPQPKRRVSDGQNQKNQEAR